MKIHYLHDKSLSLKAMGLLTLMLHLDEEYYSVQSIAEMCKEGEYSIRAGMKELEEAGYLWREQGRNHKNRFSSVDYALWEYRLITEK
ncbi:MAG: hypothetical protein Q4C00_07345 [Bacillota bacterium]|nr:hypothetical protein [Bacillota bacterium]